MTVADSRREEILAWLDEVKDPEVPVLSIRELGVLRDVEVSGDDVVVVMTPTYSGCPAMNMIAFEIELALERAGFPAQVRGLHRPRHCAGAWPGRCSRRRRGGLDRGRISG